MFSNSLKQVYILLLGLYSIANILILNGDRLYEAELVWYHLTIIVFALVYGIWYINLWIQKYRINFPTKIHTLLKHFLVSLVGIAILSLLSVLITGVILGDPYGANVVNIKLTLGFTFRVNLFLNSINAIVFYNDQFRSKAVEAEKYKSLSAQANFEILSNQINPHFLFNSLNVLSSLIHKDADQADEFLHKLSDIYRYVLKNRSNEVVTFKEELDFVNDYLDLLKVRFAEALSVNMDLKGVDSSLFIPPAVLQLLVENVIKHNTISKSHPMTISIKCQDNKLTVSNEKKLKKEKKEASGIGLKNISERYKFLNEEIEIKQDAEHFSVTLPLIKL